MKKPKVAEIRKASQFHNEQVTEVFHQVIERQLAMPFKTRKGIAARILRGKGEDKWRVFFHDWLPMISSSIISLITYIILMEIFK